ncbi:hypothetical protein ACIGCZ_29165 [Streptomyces nigra]|uniref:hypothetical protein n=1 Tax=Streptomyces nigra TaxID=1827580 RepID=UPI0037D92DD4
MYEDICAQLGKCLNPFHDHGERLGEPGLSAMVDTTDPAFNAIVTVLSDMHIAGVGLTKDTVAIAIKLGRAQHAKEAPPAVPQEATYGLRHEVVYYMRFGHCIKIGTTGTLAVRARELKPDEILAAEPGSYDLERERHRQFGRYFSEGEMYFPGPLLMAHIRKVQARYRRLIPKQTREEASESIACEYTGGLF